MFQHHDALYLVASCALWALPQAGTLLTPPPEFEGKLRRARSRFVPQWSFGCAWTLIYLLNVSGTFAFLKFGHRHDMAVWTAMGLAASNFAGHSWATNFIYQPKRALVDLIALVPLNCIVIFLLSTIWYETQQPELWILMSGMFFYTVCASVALGITLRYLWKPEESLVDLQASTIVDKGV